MKRKHKILVEVTFDKPLPAKEAKHIVHDVVDSTDFDYVLGTNPYADRRDLSIQKFVCKEGDRALAAAVQRGSRLL